MSMTGFGRGSAPFGEGTLVVEVRTVNHRFLEVRSRAVRDLLAAESLIEKLIRGAIRRGHCTVHVSCEGPAGGASRIDERALDGHIERLIRVGSRHGLCLADLVPVLSAAPDLYVLPVEASNEDLEQAVKEAFSVAAEELLGMRRAEGGSIAAQLRTMIAKTRDVVGRITGLAADCVSALQDRARERVLALLAQTDLASDPRRIEAEAALLADRADITEELSRLVSHLEQMEGLLEAEEPVGRKLEFLIQEMGREANTLGSKAGFIELTRLIVDLKALLEKQREMAQNVE